jgi:hypothetical protein
MGRWADWLVDGVRYDATRTFIQAVRAARDRPACDFKFVDKTRAELLAMLSGGETVATVFENDMTRRLERGEDVRVLTVNGDLYLRIDRAELPRDDLGDLPPL